MPTPVSSARLCLAGEAAAALDDAVAAARRRAHAQTTSLHVVFALISSASSPLLRDALSRARSSSYSPRLQFKALELCFSVALDRLPSSSSSSSSSSTTSSPPAPSDDPPVSNSLMAAIKRSQANQRRHPDTFHLYQQQQQQHNLSPSSTSSFSGVKVELQQLVLAILDDPVVSRVFGEAGFRSPDIKLAVLRPPPPILRFPRAARCPPLFLCNFSSAADNDFPAFPRFPFSSDASDENCKRIGEILARKTGCNPMLVGVGAAEAAKDFAAAVERKNWAVLPPQIARLKFVSVEGELGRVEDLEMDEEEKGVVVGIGDLKGLVEMEDEVVGCLVAQLSKVLEVNRGRLWVMGWSATYETYMKFLSKYPLLDKDWDLQLLPITSVRHSMGGLQSRPQSLPFEGFFPMAYESNSLLSKSCHTMLCCQQCNDNYEQEAAILKGSSPALDEQNQTNLPSWLRKDALDTTKVKDDKTALNDKVTKLQKKWNDYCQQLHRGCLMLETNKSQVLAPIIGLPCVSDKERVIKQNSVNPAVSQSQGGFGSMFSMALGSQKISTASQSISMPLVSEPQNKDLISGLQVRLSKSEQLQTTGFQTQQGNPSDFSICDDHASPSSVTSVTTDLVLGTLHEPSRREEKPAFRNGKEPFEDLSPCSSSKKVNERQYQNFLNSKVMTGVYAIDSRCLSSSSLHQKLDPCNYKAFFSSFLEKVGRQEEAICAICQAIVHSKSGHERRRGASLKGDIWLSFLGPDRVGKKRVAAALAELIFGSRENLICLNLAHQNGIYDTGALCDQEEISTYDVRFRGKTVADHIAGEVSKKPWSVVFLENVDKADLLVQNSLSQALQTGKFSDSHGREFSISNAIFITTAKTALGKASSPIKENINFSEERILGAQRWQMKILIEPISEAMTRSSNANVSIALRHESGRKPGPSCSVFVSKRKLDVSDHQKEPHESLGTAKRPHKISNTFLDLNLPVDAGDNDDTNCSSSSSGDEAWLEEFLDLMDEAVHFKPFNFDALAEYILKEIGKRFSSTVGTELSLEIDVKVMEQLLAATWLLEDIGDLNNWIEQVLCRSFVELKRRYNNKLPTHCVLRLVAGETLVEEHAPRVLLPARIIVE